MKWLKKIFGKKEEKAIEEISLNSSELKDWIEKNSKDKISEFYSLAKKKEEILKDILKKLEKNKDKLRSASLRNPNISARELHFMTGNREAYIRAIDILISKIDLEYIKRPEIFFLKYKEAIEDFSKTTIRPYHIVKEFFGEEASDIASSIKELDDTLKEYNLNRKDYVSIKKLEKDIEELYEKTEYHDQTKEKKEDIKKRITRLEEEENTKEEELKELKESKGYETYKEILKKEDMVKEEINMLKHKVDASFSPVQKALKKYERIATEDEDVIKRYLLDSYSALKKDYDLKIISILRKVKDTVSKDNIGLKDKIKEKTIKTIETLDKDTLKKYIDESEKKEELLKKIKDDITKDTNVKEEEKIKEDLKKIRYKEEELKKEIDIKDKEIKNISIDDQKKKIIEKIDKTFKVNIILD